MLYPTGLGDVMTNMRTMSCSFLVCMFRDGDCGAFGFGVFIPSPVIKVFGRLAEVL
jgi:hypothetical protein